MDIYCLTITYSRLAPQRAKQVRVGGEDKIYRLDRKPGFILLFLLVCNLRAIRRCNLSTRLQFASVVEMFLSTKTCLYNVSYKNGSKGWRRRTKGIYSHGVWINNTAGEEMQEQTQALETHYMPHHITQSWQWYLLLWECNNFVTFMQNAPAFHPLGLSWFCVSCFKNINILKVFLFFNFLAW